MSKTGSRLAVFVCNILIVALSAAAILSHLLFPLWRVHIVFPIQEKLLKEMLPEEMADLDVGEIVGDGIPVSVTLEIRTKDVFSSFTDTGVTAIESTIERNVDSVVDQLTPTLDEIAEKFSGQRQNRASTTFSANRSGIFSIRKPTIQTPVWKKSSRKQVLTKNISIPPSIPSSMRSIPKMPPSTASPNKRCPASKTLWKTA